MNLGEYASKYTSGTKVVSAIEFIQSPSGFSTKLFPSQRFLIKVLDQEELDNELRDIEIKDQFNERVVHVFTELEFYNFLRAEGRISLDYADYLAYPMVQNLLAIGRRGTKTSTVSLWVGAKLYHLLSIDHPQRYFGILPEDPITVTITALGEDNAEKLFSRLSNLLSSSRFFKKHMLVPVGVQSVRLWTNHDLQTRKGPTSNSISVNAWANSPSVRGENNVFAVMEEIAHFNVKQSTKDRPLDKMIYDSLTPSVSSFSKPDGSPFGRTFLVSTPLGKQGLFHELHEKAFELGGDTGCLAIRAPTWYFNTTKVSSIYLRSEFTKNSSGYSQEYGAEFSGFAGGWIDDKDLYRCFIRTTKSNPLPRGLDDNYVLSLAPTSRVKHYLGCDFALSNDGTAFGISHFEKDYVENPNYFHSKALSFDLDLCDRVVKECGASEVNPWLDSNFVRGELEFDESHWKMDNGVYLVDYMSCFYAGETPYDHLEVLDAEDLLDMVQDLYRRWPIVGGIFDQWSGELVNQMLKKRNLNRLHMIKFTEHDKEIVNTTFMNLCKEGKIKIAYNVATELGLSSLVGIKTAKGFKVESRSGYHDDIYDAIARSVFLCHADRMGLKTFGGLNFKELFAKGSSALISSKQGKGNFNPMKTSQKNPNRARERDIKKILQSRARVAGM